MRRIIVTVSTGNLPMADSELSITALVPSSTAFATSQASARVGKGLSSMDASISVAQTTYLPAAFVFEIIIFCAIQIFSMGISMPKSPRATMMESLASMISSMFFKPSSFSIFEMILMLRPRGPKVSRISLTSAALCTKDAAMKSTPWGMPKFTKSSMSFCCNTGKSTFTPGKLQFLRSPNFTLFMTVVMTWSEPTESTFRDKEPSAQRMMFPAFTDWHNMG
mmetsp:Transcript_13824/g.36973  ORF Transcript_13824/g.36973 Transcript_13824/m.36973 type:complete len:222 (-) Transcript_13824:857-1522(-)